MYGSSEGLEESEGAPECDEYDECDELDESEESDGPGPGPPPEDEDLCEGLEELGELEELFDDEDGDRLELQLLQLLDHE